MRTPTLGEPWMDDPEEIRIDLSRTASGIFGRAPFPSSSGPSVAGYRVVVHIPFDGDGAVFLLAPSTFTTTVPMARVGNRELIHVIEYPHDQQADIRASTDKLVREVERHLRWANDDIEQYNASLEQRARAAIENRRARVKRHREHLAATGLPTRPKEGSPKTYIADAIVRLPAPVLPTTPTSAPIALEPVLGDEVFEHILGVIRSVGLDMERSPKTYAGKGEEDRRQFLLAALNTHYQGAVIAEAFNVSGKTDILIRHEGRNLFIAKGKFWGGAERVWRSHRPALRLRGLARHEARPHRLRAREGPDEHHREGAGGAWAARAVRGVQGGGERDGAPVAARVTSIPARCRSPRSSASAPQGHQTLRA